MEAAMLESNHCSFLDSLTTVDYRKLTSSHRVRSLEIRAEGPRLPPESTNSGGAGS
jgi:hypothetical protein